MPEFINAYENTFCNYSETDGPFGNPYNKNNEPNYHYYMKNTKIFNKKVSLDCDQKLF